VDALRCAVEVQRETAGLDAGVQPDERIELRIGINVGDIVVEDGDIFGGGVNVAARLEGLAEPGGICVSARVQEDAVGKLDLAFEDLGEQALKNIARPIRVYRIVNGAVSATAAKTHALPLPEDISVALVFLDPSTPNARNSLLLTRRWREVDSNHRSPSRASSVAHSPGSHPRRQ